jgi:hypothetical protein
MEEKRTRHEALAHRVMREFYGASMDLDADLRSVYRRLAARFRAARASERTARLIERRLDAAGASALVCPRCLEVHPDEERVCLA